jgi:hypothetical protein
MKFLKWLSAITSILAFIILLATLAAPGADGQTAILGAIGLAVIPYVIVGAIERLNT